MLRLTHWLIAVALVIALMGVALSPALAAEGKKGKGKKAKKPAAQEAAQQWQDSFDIQPSDLSSTGKNDYFSLEPGYQLVLEGKEGDKSVRLVVSVLAETKKVGDVETRIVEEKETVDGKNVETSRNYFAISKTSKNVYYFGEDVGGAWLAGEKGAKPGMMMPGKVQVGAKFYEEVAPGVAMDRAEIVGNKETVETPAGKFVNCVKIEETTPLEPDTKEYKLYAPGIGLVKEGGLLLTKHGFAKQEKGKKK
jgi:hypothetical protein